MYELIQVGEKTYYINCPARMGIYKLDETRVCLIDSGNDKEAGKKVLKILAANNWTLGMIINTHSHADHIGGNGLLQQRTGCPIYGVETECAFTTHTILESSLLYGGYPYKKLQNKFLMAKPSIVQELTEEVLPKGMEMLRVDGHTFSMAALKTEDDVWFLADCVTSEAILDKYHISFLQDVEAYLASLKIVEELTGRLFIPSHSEPVNDIKPLVQINRQKAYEIIDTLRQICVKPVGFDEILKSIFDKYQLIMDSNQHVLVGSTIRSYLSYLYNNGELQITFRNNEMKWQISVENPTENDLILSINEDKDGILANIICFALDMDGTIYLGEQWIEGAVEFIENIKSAGKEYVFLTNNSSKNASVYVEKLKRMGLSITEDQIVTSGQATISYLKKKFKDKRVFLLGNSLLAEEFEQAGIVLDNESPEVVVTAFDTTITYDKMCKVCDFVRMGLPYISTHPDYNCPTETGFIPDAGAIHAFIHASANRYPDHIIGKPSGEIIDYLLERFNLQREKVAMVGDRLYTDIAAGRNNGLKSVLVLSGEASLEDLKDSEIKPHLIFDSVKEMITFL